MRILSRLFVAATATFVVSVPAFAQNLGFETGDLTGWGSDGAVFVTNSITIAGNTANPTEGAFEAVLFTGGGVTSDAADADLNLPAGTLQGSTGVPLTTGSVLWKDIYISQDYPGNSFDVQFLAGDYLPYDDTGFLTISLLSSPFYGAFPYFSVSTVGDFGASGWQNLGYFGVSFFPGVYRVGFAAFNGLDNSVTSALVVDNLQVASVPEPGAYVTAAFLFGGVGLGMLRARRKK